MTDRFCAGFLCTPHGLFRIPSLTFGAQNWKNPSHNSIGLTKNLSPHEIRAQGLDSYFVDHTVGVWPQAASGMPFSSASLQCTGDPIADLFEDLAAEQKARLTYDNILRLIDDPDVIAPIRFLRAREVVHFQRFGEGLRRLQDKLDCKNYYACNPSFDKCCMK